MSSHIRILRRFEPRDVDESVDVQELASRAADALDCYLRCRWAGSNEENRLPRLKLALRLLGRIAELEIRKPPARS